MIPAGYQVRGDGRSVVVDCNAGAALADAVVSSAVIPGPFLVVGALLWTSADLTSGALLTVVGAPINVNAVAGVRLPISGVQLFAGGPSFVGSLDPDPIGDASGRGTHIAYWPWYLYDGDSGALALWVRNPGIGTMRWWAAVSVWPLVREDEAIPREVAFSPFRAFNAPVERFPPPGRKFEIVVGGGGLYWTIVERPVS